ncbi:hypothetical protein [Roseomonas harenae]|uniref:hypothetical protein n=1 Tax=Muricoccus harenae TaxID=2692566 RepID=UPI001331B09F|nr:hypothetical protein [Roseomonas harenae]
MNGFIVEGTPRIEIYVYAGHGAMTANDWRSGILAGSATMTSVNAQNGVITSISVDPHAVNSVLATNPDYLGINIRAAETHGVAGISISPLSTMSLDLVF